MAKSYSEQQTLINAGNRMGMSNTMMRDKGIPLDSSSIQTSSTISTYAGGANAYVGQIITVVPASAEDTTTPQPYVIKDEAGNLKRIICDDEQTQNLTNKETDPNTEEDISETIFLNHKKYRAVHFTSLGGENPNTVIQEEITDDSDLDASYKASVVMPAYMVGMQICRSDVASIKDCDQGIFGIDSAGVLHATYFNNATDRWCSLKTYNSYDGGSPKFNSILKNAAGEYPTAFKRVFIDSRTASATTYTTPLRTLAQKAVEIGGQNTTFTGTLCIGGTPRLVNGYLATGSTSASGTIGYGAAVTLGYNGANSAVINVFNAHKDHSEHEQFNACEAVIVDVPDTRFEGNVQASTFTAYSDIRLKENIIPYNCNNSILDLPIYKFDFKNSDSKNNIGCLAQDLQKICPEIVHEDPNTGYLSIEESKIVYLLLNEVKQLRKELDELRKEYH